VRDWFAIALEASVYRRALKVTVVVGSILAGINHWDVMLAGAFTATVWTKIGMTYLVPYCVSTYSSVQAIRHRRAGAPRA
jgi:hypothetical protein